MAAAKWALNHRFSAAAQKKFKPGFVPRLGTKR